MEDTDSVRGIIAEACKHRRTHLNLSNKALENFPPQILLMKERLQSLMLLANCIKELPEEIMKELKHLKSLDISSNMFRGKPPSSICTLSSLVELSMLSNYLCELPEDMYRLTNLRVLALSGNDFREIPLPLFALPWLEVLYLNYNCITYVPPQIKNLIRLKKLCMGYNLIKEFGENDICGMQNIEELFLRCNSLRFLPAGVANMKKLRRLAVSGNHPLSREVRNLRNVSNEHLPSLKELAATCTVQNKIEYNEMCLELLDYIVNNQHFCSCCKEMFISEHPISFLAVKNLGVEDMVMPLKYEVCSVSCKVKIAILLAKKRVRVVK